ADLLTKSFDVTRFGYLVVNIVSACLVCWTNLLKGNIVDLWFLFTSAGRVTFCWLFSIPAGDLVSAGHMLFLLWFLFTSAGRVTFCWLFPIPAGDLVSAGHMLFLLVIQLWGSTSEVSLPDGVRGLVATIDGTIYTVTEASIRSALQLDDINAIDTMTNEEIFAGLRDIGYTTEGKFTFFKNKFSPQWKFLIHTLIHCLSPKSGSWNQFASNIAIALICLSTRRKYNFLTLFLMFSPPPIPFGPAPTSRVVSNEPILDIPSLSRPSEPVLETITSPFGDDDTGGGSCHESPPRPPPVTPTLSLIIGVAEEPLTLTSLLALFPNCLQRIATLEAELKATKILHRDTVVLFAKR
nr:synaptobrevin, longin-like domain protein [Tanacetum cinerariifolium]